MSLFYDVTDLTANKAFAYISRVFLPFWIQRKCRKWASLESV